MRNQIPLPTIQNVAAGATCVLNLPIGMTYDQVVFKLTNVTPAQMLNYKLKLGARTITDIGSAAVLADQNTYYKRHEDAGRFTHWFYRPEVKEDVRMLTSLGTADLAAQGLGNITIEFKLDPGVVNPAIEAVCVQRAPQALGLITKVREFPLAYATSGKQQIDNIMRGARITAMHLKKSDISKVEFEINNGTGPAKIIDVSKADLESLQRQNNRAPITASYTHIDFNLTGDLAGPIPTAQLVDMRVNPTLDTAGAVTVVVEYIDGIGGI